MAGSVIKKVYSDMADNLSKVTFKVYVKESYVPVIHYAFLGEGAPPPIRQITDENMNDLCTSFLSARYIIDALVNGHYVQFANLEDMVTVRNWIRLYLDQYKGLDLSRYPDRVAFNKNAEKAYEMLSGNIKRKEDWDTERTPRKLTIADLLSAL